MISTGDRLARLRTLTPSQLQLLRLGQRGNSAQEIADLLGLTPQTALLERGIAYDKLGLASLPQRERLDELAAFYDADREAPIDPVAAAHGSEPAQASAAALAAVEQDDRLLSRGAVVAPPVAIEERRTEPLGPVAARGVDLGPPPVLLDPAPRAWWGADFGPAAWVALFVAAVVLVALLGFLFMRTNQPAAPQAITPATQVAEVAPPQAQAPAQAPAPPAPPAAAPQTPGPQAVAPQAPPPVIIVQPPAPAPAAAAPAAAAPAAPAPAAAPAAPPSVAAPAATADTPAGSILTPGQTWRQNGLELTLTSAQVSSNGVTVNFMLMNRRTSRTDFNFTRGSAFAATDNKNTRLQVSNANYADKFALDPNASVILDAAHAGGAVAFSGRLSDGDVTGVTIRVNGVDALSNAQWRIPIQH